MEFKLNLLPVDEETELASSHILGCPDVPSKWNDEAVFNNDEIFIGQLNLNDLAIDKLPNVGILYFFLAVGSKPYRGIVRYTKDLSNLERIDFNSEIPFSYDLNKEYSLSNGAGELKILPENLKLKKYHLNKNELILLSLDLEFLKDDNYDLVYLIKEDDLKKGNLDKAYLSVNLDD